MTDNCNDATKFHPKIGNVVRASPQSHPTPPPISSYPMGQRTEEKLSEIRNKGRLHQSDGTGSGSNHWSDTDALSRLLQIFNFYFCSHSARCGRDNGNVLSFCGDGPWDLELRGKLPHYGVPRRRNAKKPCENE